jgi:hypothetical protein
VCSLLLAADLVWLRLMLDSRDSLAGVQATIAFAGQGLAAGTLAFVMALLLRKRYDRQKKPVRWRISFGILQPIRRLFVSVLF